MSRRVERSAGGVHHRARIVLLDEDPYAAFLLGAQFPHIELIEPGEDVPVDELDLARGDVVIVAVSDDRLRSLLARRPAIRVVVVAGRGLVSDEEVGKGTDGLVQRPFLPSELLRVVGRALGRGPLLGRARDRGTMATWLAGARLVSTAFAATVSALSPAFSGGTVAVLLAVVFAYVGLRLVWRSLDNPWVVADLVLAGVLLALTGGLASPYVLYAVVATIAAGIVMPGSLAMIIGLLMGAVALVATLLGTTGETLAGLTDLTQLSGLLLFPGGVLVGELVGRLHVEPSSGAQLLHETNQVLRTLLRTASTMPGSFELRNVLSAVQAELRESLAAPAAVVLVEQGGILACLGYFGLESPPKAVLETDIDALVAVMRDDLAPLDLERVPDELSASLVQHPSWVAIPLDAAGALLGVLLVAEPTPMRIDGDRWRRDLRALARETAIAVDNAALFERTRSLAVDEERRRVSRELHDGVAQVLTHVRLEIGLLERRGLAQGSDEQSEFRRLGEALDRAIEDVRRTMHGLRSVAASGGLVSALRDYVRDMRGLGTAEVVFEALGTVALAPEVESELFRIVQEAVSNALRHSGARHIGVLVDAREIPLSITVADDGRWAAVRGDPGGGLGISAMHERADRIGASIAVEPGADGGTRVVVEYDPVATQEMFDIGASWTERTLA